ncbi:MAG: hypothetical protein KAS36_02975, partial [Anaerolineales bacterium]|nr:hypothetical protein [Anaerolineales bacterium]
WRLEIGGWKLVTSPEICLQKIIGTRGYIRARPVSRNITINNSATALAPLKNVPPGSADSSAMLRTSIDRARGLGDKKLFTWNGTRIRAPALEID